MIVVNLYLRNYNNSNVTPSIMTNSKIKDDKYCYVLTHGTFYYHIIYALSTMPMALFLPHCLLRYLYLSPCLLCYLPHCLPSYLPHCIYIYHIIRHIISHLIYHVIYGVIHHVIQHFINLFFFFMQISMLFTMLSTVICHIIFHVINHVINQPYLYGSQSLTTLLTW